MIYIDRIDVYLTKNSREEIRVGCTGKNVSAPTPSDRAPSACIRRKLCVPGAQFHCFARPIHTNNIINDKF